MTDPQQQSDSVCEQNEIDDYYHRLAKVLQKAGRPGDDFARLTRLYRSAKEQEMYRRERDAAYAEARRWERQADRLRDHCEYLKDAVFTAHRMGRSFAGVKDADLHEEFDLVGKMMDEKLAKADAEWAKQEAKR